MNKLKTHKPLPAEEQGDKIDVCPACFAKRYYNIWLGLNLGHGVCQFCHKQTVIDRIPNIGHLQPREEVE